MHKNQLSLFVLYPCKKCYLCQLNSAFLSYTTKLYSLCFRNHMAWQPRYGQNLCFIPYFFYGSKLSTTNSWMVLSYSGHDQKSVGHWYHNGLSHCHLGGMIPSWSKATHLPQPCVAGSNDGDGIRPRLPEGKIFGGQPSLGS